MENRVQGELAVSRSLGDFIYKESGVVCHPDTKRHEILPDDEWILLASDGIWDGLDN